MFSPEFLARIKRIIVFQPLEQAAMVNITRKLVGELRRTWVAKRGKELVVAESLIAHVAEQAHRLNEKSQGKEGGRVVRKLIADWIEAPLQRAVTDRPADYRGCENITLDFQSPEAPPAEGPLPPPKVAVVFGRTAA